MTIEEVREKYGTAVAKWCEEKLRTEGELPDEARIARRVRPSDPPGTPPRGGPTPSGSPSS